MIPGLSYGAHTGSITYPRRFRSREVVRQDVAVAVLDLVHPGNLGELPPSPRTLAWKGEQMGVINHKEMWETIWF